MRKLVLLLLVICGCQSANKIPETLKVNYSPTISEMLGVCAGPNVDGFTTAGILPDYIKNFRYFYLQEKDFINQTDPSSFQPIPCPLPCNKFDCWNITKSSFADNKYRLCRLDKAFENIHVTWEAIGVKGKMRPWPDKWYTDQEWGNNYEERVDNAFVYTKHFLQTICPEGNCIIQVLEIGNEPWGLVCPGMETYHAIQEGVIKAFIDFFGSEEKEEWKIKLSTGAFHGKQSRPKLLDGIEEMTPKKFRKYYDFISIHAYARDSKGSVNASPIDGGEFSFYNRIAEMERWRQENMAHAKLNLTEFGWNGDNQNGVGEEKQINYLVQALLIAQRFGIHRTFIYELEDQPKVQMFNSMGLYEAGSHKPKGLYFALEDFVKKYGQLQFIEVIEESNTGFKYGFGMNNKITYIFQGNYSTGKVLVNNRDLELERKNQTRFINEYGKNPG